MKREDYRAAFDRIPFSADFTQRTQALLHARARELEKERKIMKLTGIRKKLAVAAAAVAALAVSVSAAVLLLTPSQVAARSGQEALAAAFESAEAVQIDKSGTVGDYDVTLQGLVSGRGLTDWVEVDESRTYVALSVTRRDGAPLSEVPTELAFTPLIQGYNAWSVNAWTLGGGWTAFAENGTGYYLFETDSVEKFADRTVYFAVYQGMAPGAEQFEMHADGSITLREGVEGVLFPLPLDASKADPAAVRALIEQLGIQDEPLMTDAARAALDTGAVRAEQHADGVYIVPADDQVLPAFTAEEFAAYADAEKARLARELQDGVLSQATYDNSLSDLEADLAGVRDGSLTAYRVDGGYATIQVSGDCAVSYSATPDGTELTIH